VYNKPTKKPGDRRKENMKIKLLESSLDVDPSNVVYVPTGICGYPHSFCTVAAALEAGAKNIQVSAYEGVETPWAGMVADWPPSLFE